MNIFILLLLYLRWLNFKPTQYTYNFFYVIVNIKLFMILKNKKIKKQVVNVKKIKEDIYIILNICIIILIIIHS